MQARGRDRRGWPSRATVEVATTLAVLPALAFSTFASDGTAALLVTVLLGAPFACMVFVGLRRFVLAAECAPGRVRPWVAIALTVAAWFVAGVIEWAVLAGLMSILHWPFG